MPQNETTLFLHILLNFLFFTLTLAVFILLYNFLPTFKYIKLLFLLDRDVNFTEFNFLFLICNITLRNTELTLTTVPLINFISISNAFAFYNIFQLKSFSQLYLRLISN